MLLYENAYICFTVSLVIPINAIILRNESHELRTFDSLCLALTVVNGHHTTYHECIRSILRIMNALQFEKNHRRIAILKYIWLLVLRRMGIILYDTFILTGCKSCLLSAEVALLFAQHTNVFGLIYLATLWHCQGRYKQCIKLICNATKNCTGIPLNAIIYNESLTNKCTKTPCDYISLFEHHFVKPTVEIHRTSHLCPNELNDLVKQSEFFDFSTCIESYYHFLLFLSYYNLRKKAECIKMMSELLNSYRELPFNLIDGIIEKNTKKLVDIAKKKMKNFRL